MIKINSLGFFLDLNSHIFLHLQNQQSQFHVLKFYLVIIVIFSLFFKECGKPLGQTFVLHRNCIGRNNIL